MGLNRPDIEVSASIVSAGRPLQYDCVVDVLNIRVDAVASHRLLDSLVRTATMLVTDLPDFQEDRSVGGYRKLNAIIPQLNIIHGILMADLTTRKIPSIGMPVLFDLRMNERNTELIHRTDVLFYSYLKWHKRYREQEHAVHGPHWGNNFDGVVEKMCEEAAAWVKEVRA